ncbi:MAG: hypothetical protein ACI9MF_001669, partial [Gammaproteobacteria bacterium]
VDIKSIKAVPKVSAKPELNEVDSRIP